MRSMARGFPTKQTVPTKITRTLLCFRQGGRGGCPPVRPFHHALRAWSPFPYRDGSVAFGSLSAAFGGEPASGKLQ